MRIRESKAMANKLTVSKMMVNEAVVSKMVVPEVAERLARCWSAWC